MYFNFLIEYTAPHSYSYILSTTPAALLLQNLLMTAKILNLPATGKM